MGRWSKRGCSAGRWRKKEPGETATPGKSLPSTTDTDDTPMCETFDLLTVGTMVAEASRSLQSTSNTDDTPIGETPDMLTGSTLAERSVRSLLPTTDMGDTPIGETPNTLTGDMLAANTSDKPAGETLGTPVDERVAVRPARDPPTSDMGDSPIGDTLAIETVAAVPSRSGKAARSGKARSGSPMCEMRYRLRAERVTWQR